ncbi:hypothetical protein BraRD5C2_38690 [Bradyrhizobium sp. RD5-C2]|nr:hypothetical protein BraRD5C2_38690 [Bradyrhizobium sp. RD5-C2]
MAATASEATLAPAQPPSDPGHDTRRGWDKTMHELKSYVAFAVDTAGVARATYELLCIDDEEA